MDEVLDEVRGTAESLEAHLDAASKLCRKVAPTIPLCENYYTEIFTTRKLLFTTRKLLHVAENYCTKITTRRRNYYTAGPY